jgi:redox-sensitive bicupin YhaK (pirin superfamily)
MSMKKILSVQSAPPPHWVGDGFPVRSLFSYATRGLPLSPFLLLDHAGPVHFEPSRHRRGVGEHPHRGFETVTIVYSGEVEHRDSSGGGGVIGPGDVQWMTAGDGIVHEEFHSEAFAQRGGDMEMVQLWVNLPALHKRTPPRYQAIRREQIPDIELADGAGRLRLIAGEFDGQQGAADTFSPVEVWDLRLNPGKRVALPAANGRSLLVIVLDGTVQVNDEAILRSQQMAVLDVQGDGFSLEANGDAKVLVLGGQPLDEPVVGYGPFVMNTQAEIRQAIEDYNGGRFGRPS